MSDETKPGHEVRDGSRIAKVMARAGLCSRREAEAWIAEGRVSVNGKALTSPAFNVSDADDVRVDGKPLEARERTRLFLFHKPRGLVTTARDPEGRATIFDALPQDLPRLVAVGRLDINTEGLILLTNDGGLARVLELPATGWLRRYRVRAHGSIGQAELDALRDGITIDGIVYAGIEARLDREQGSNAWMTMGLREGKNRELKVVLESIGLSVNRLIRVSFGPFELGDLAEGEVLEVRTRILRDQLGAKLAREAGADFEAPVVDRSPPPVAPPAAEPRRRPDRPFQDRPRPSSRDRGHDDRERGASPRRGPEKSTPERQRKHVSALRAEIASDASGPRKRVRRSATQDRKGRTVAVERISKAEAGGEPAPERRSRADKPGPRPRRSEGRSRWDEAGREAGERPRRPNSFEVKRARDGEGRERRQRTEDGARAALKPGAKSVQRDGDKRPFRPDRGEPRRDRPAKGEGFPGRDGRTRSDGEKRPFRSERGEPRRDRPAKGEGFPGRDGRTRSDGEKRPFRSERGEPRRDRPAKGEGFPARDGRSRGAGGAASKAGGRAEDRRPPDRGGRGKFGAGEGRGPRKPPRGGDGGGPRRPPNKR